MHSTACDLRVRTANHAHNYFTLGSTTILDIDTTSARAVYVSIDSYSRVVMT